MRALQLNTKGAYSILILNAGSSSLKYKLFTVSENQSLSSQCHGKFEQISNETQYTHYSSPPISDIKTAKYTHSNGGDLDTLDYVQSINILFEELLNIDSNSKQSFVIGHRIVHGGNTYSKAQMIDTQVLSVINKYSQIAPLHNPYQLQCIESVTHILNIPKIDTQFAIFDTAFHSHLPECAHKYAINKDICSEYESKHSIPIRRYGFHGISFEYVLHKCARYLNKGTQMTNLIALHLGNGSSVCCVKKGVSVETSMGFTPLEGLIMGTRSGDIDSGLVLELMSDGCDTAAEMKDLLNKHSGLKGICGTNDMRLILSDTRNSEYELALDMFAHRIKKYIGSYYALLGGNVDALVFTGGIGENIPHKLVQKIVCNMERLGFAINETPHIHDKEGVTVWSKSDKSGEQSMIPILSIKTDEELAMAQQIQKQILSESKKT